MKKRGQVWVETVTYTLVAFVLISLILSFAKPKIEELQDQTAIQQSIQMLKDIDEVVREVEEQGIGNKRKLEITLKKGTLSINSTEDKLIFHMKGKFMYSQPGQIYTEGSLQVLTEEEGRDYYVTIEKSYDRLNLRYAGLEQNKVITPGTNPYIVYISNEEGGSGNIINFEME